jgi:hypothetical protein
VSVSAIGPVISSVRINPENGLVARAAKHLVANEVEANADAA